MFSFASLIAVVVAAIVLIPSLASAPATFVLPLIATIALGMFFIGLSSSKTAESHSDDPYFRNY